MFIAAQETFPSSLVPDFLEANLFAKGAPLLDAREKAIWGRCMGTPVLEYEKGRCTDKNFWEWCAMHKVLEERGLLGFGS